MNSLRRLFRTSSTPVSRRRTRRACQPQALALESRRLLTLSFASANGLNLNVPVENGLANYLNTGVPGIVKVGVDSSGDTYLAGQYNGTVNFDFKNHSSTYDRTSVNGTFDLFVAKYDPSGNLLWLQTGNSPETDSVNGFTVKKASDGNTYVYLSGMYQGTQSQLSGLFSTAGFTGSGPLTNGTPSGSQADAFIMRLTSAGAVSYSSDIRTTSGGTVDTPSAITADASGNAYVTGFINQGQVQFATASGTTSVPTNPSGTEVSYVAKFDTSGHTSWVDLFAPPSSPSTSSNAVQSSGIAVDSQNNVITTGTFVGQIDFSGSANGSQVKTSSSQNGFDIYVSKLSSSGAYIFANTYGNGAGNHGQDVAVDSHDNIFVTGQYTPYIDLSQNPNGVNVGLNFNPNGGSATTGILYGTLPQLAKSTTASYYNPALKRDITTDIFALKLNPDGSYAWATGMDVSVDNNLTVNSQIAVGPNDLVYVGGTRYINDNKGSQMFVAQLSDSAGPLAPNPGMIMGYASGGGSGSKSYNNGNGGTVTFTNDDMLGGLAVNPTTGNVVAAGVSRLGAQGAQYAPTFENTAQYAYAPPAFPANTAFTLPNSDTWITTLNATTKYSKAPDDFDGDGKTDLVNYRPDTSTFVIALSSGGSIVQQFGWPGHVKPIQGDYDGDGRADIGIFQPSTSTFLVIQSSNGQSFGRGYGNPSLNPMPLSGDFNGDGKTDMAVFYPDSSTFEAALSGNGNPANPHNGWLHQQFGIPGVMVANALQPITGDFNGDGITDVGVYYPDSLPQFNIVGSTFAIAYVHLGGPGAQVSGGFSRQFGVPGGSVPVPGDYNGDGITDLAVFVPSNATFYVGDVHADGTVSGGFFQQYGIPGTVIPMTGDYNGDGITDIATYDPSSATYYVAYTNNTGTGVGGGFPKQFGIPGKAKALTSSYDYYA